jgi:hypothetical protein
LRASLIVVLVAFLSTLFTSLAQAVGTNTLTLHVSEGHRAPYAYEAWRLTDTTTPAATLLPRLAGMSDNDLAAAHPDNFRSSPVDDLGNGHFTDLPDGRYYVRATHADDTSTTSIIAPLIVDVPQIEADGTVTRDVVVHPKQFFTPEPPEPGTPATPEPGAPGTPEPGEPEPGKPEPGQPVPGTPEPGTPGLPVPGVVPQPPTPGTTPTGGERFQKISRDGQPLAGAIFNVVQRGDNGELEPVTMNGRRLVAHSDNSGNLSVVGVPHGTYYLVEATAPAGYQLLSTPVEFTVNATSYDDGVVLQIVNLPKPPGTIPKTGDLSLILSLTAGAILIGMGMHLSRQRRPATK